MKNIDIVENSLLKDPYKVLDRLLPYLVSNGNIRKLKIFEFDSLVFNKKYAEFLHATAFLDVFLEKLADHRFELIWDWLSKSIHNFAKILNLRFFLDAELFIKKLKEVCHLTF